MKRYTTRQEDGQFSLPLEELVLENGQAKGEAIERLGAFENFYEQLLIQQSELAAQLEELRKQNKTKTAKFREALGKKLVGSQILTLLQLNGLGE